MAKAKKHGLKIPNIRYLKKGSLFKLANSKKGVAYRIYTADLRPHGVTTLLVGKKDAKVVQRRGLGTVIEQRVYGADGRLKTVYTIDSGSETFGSDLRYAFKKNVARARRENKKRFGTADAIIQKG